MPVFPIPPVRVSDWLRAVELPAGVKQYTRYDTFLTLPIMHFNKANGKSCHYNFLEDAWQWIHMEQEYVTQSFHILSVR